ncbi:hypothetical protein PUN28_010320 [Cardiocondyla obscurior]
MQQDPQETGTFYTVSSSGNNNEHNDATSIQLQPQQLKMENICNASQQHIVACQPETCKTNSENLPIQRSLSTLHTVVDQNLKSSTIPENQCQELNCDKNLTSHKQMPVQMQRQNSTTIAHNVNELLNDQMVNNCQNVHHTQYSPLQQNNQQIQHNIYDKQMLPQMLTQKESMSNYQQHLFNNSGMHHSQLFTVQSFGQGMTSPQDMTVNQMRLMQHNLPNYQQNLRYSDRFQSIWPQNDRWNQYRQHLQLPSQWQYYCQTHGTNLNQQNFESQNQCTPLQNQANHKLNTSPSTVEIYSQRERQKILQFTPDMIHDQELLISTMRQQGVPEEVMRRQFDALLKEQKRYLTYIAQFQQKPDIPDETKKTRVVRKRTEKDEKPEWMVRITPSRITYKDIEKLNVQKGNLNEQYTINDKSSEYKIIADQQNNQQFKNEEICNQVLPQQMHVQINPYQLRKTTNWPNKNNHRMSCDHTACHSCNHLQNVSRNLYNSTSKYAQHPCNMHYNLCFPYSNSQEVWSKAKEYNSNLLPPLENKRPIETSSLLKMRKYKEIICPQKRNNGLQDLDSIQKTLETLKNPTRRKGFEHLANLAKKKPIVRLNGIQNFNEIPENMQPQLSTESALSQKKISANGLENSRNLNNPHLRVLRPKRADELLAMEYPRQKENARNYYNMQTERDNNTVTTLQNQNMLSPLRNHLYGSVPYDRQNRSIVQEGNNEMTFQYEDAAAPRYHQMQQYYSNEHDPLGHTGGQGDVACMQYPNAPDATKINRAAGDTAEKLNVEETKKRVSRAQIMQGTNAFSQPEIRETKSIAGITYP